MTGLIEATDETALAAWDVYGRQTVGKPYSRNRRGGLVSSVEMAPGA